MRRKDTLSFATVHVLQAIAKGHRYGFDIMDITGLPSGTVYPALSRLEDSALVKSRWENQTIAHAEKRPPRRYYEITGAGTEALEGALEQFRALSDLPEADLHEAKPVRTR